MPTVKPQPLSLPNGGDMATTTLAQEALFWNGLRCSFDEVRHERVDVVDGGSTVLFSCGLRLYLPEESVLAWARYDVAVDGAVCTALVPQRVDRPSVPYGPLMVKAGGGIDREMIEPAEGGLRPLVVGWCDPDGTAVWEVLPIEGLSVHELTPLIVRCGIPDGSDIVGRQRLVAMAFATANDPSTRRLALFESAFHSNQGELVAGPLDVHALLEPVTIVDLDAPVEQIRRAVATGSAKLIVAMVDGTVRDLMTLADVDNLDDRSGTPNERRPAPLTVDFAVTIDDVAAALRERLLTDPATIGAVILAGGRPLGVLRTETVLSLAGIPVRGLDELGGAPIGALIFECAEHGEQVSVDYYDPDEPPQCSHGDLMKRRR